MIDKVVNCIQAAVGFLNNLSLSWSNVNSYQAQVSKDVEMIQIACQIVCNMCIFQLHCGAMRTNSVRLNVSAMDIAVRVRWRYKQSLGGVARPRSGTRSGPGPTL